MCVCVCVWDCVGVCVYLCSIVIIAVCVSACGIEIDLVLKSDILVYMWGKLMPKLNPALII